jgi:ArsR family transcriptional regulator
MGKAFPVNINDILKALAHPTRRNMLNWMKNPKQSFSNQNNSFDNGVCAGYFADKTNLPKSTVSAHLSTLKRARLIVSLKIGQWIYYSRDEAVIGKFIDRIQDEL